jgi:hypothetical protein
MNTNELTAQAIMAFIAGGDVNQRRLTFDRRYGGALGITARHIHSTGETFEITRMASMAELTSFVLGPDHALALRIGDVHHDIDGVLAAQEPTP